MKINGKLPQRRRRLSVVYVPHECCLKCVPQMYVPMYLPHLCASLSRSQCVCVWLIKFLFAFFGSFLCSYLPLQLNLPQVASTLYTQLGVCVCVRVCFSFTA